MHGYVVLHTPVNGCTFVRVYAYVLWSAHRSVCNTVFRTRILLHVGLCLCMCACGDMAIRWYLYARLRGYVAELLLCNGLFGIVWHALFMSVSASRVLSGVAVVESCNARTVLVGNVHRVVRAQHPTTIRPRCFITPQPRCRHTDRSCVFSRACSHCVWLTALLCVMIDVSTSRTW